MPRNLALLGLLLAASCTVGPEHPVDRPGSWRATGANANNLQVMIADPRDLGLGEAAATDRGNAGALAVTRLYRERRRQLIRESSSQVSAEQQTQDAPLPGLDDAPTGAQARPAALSLSIPGASLAPAPASAVATPAPEAR